MTTEATAPGLLVDSISKSYGPTRALSDVSLLIRPGQVTALIGHNGAGKSTLLRSLSGAEVPTASLTPCAFKAFRKSSRPGAGWRCGRYNSR